MSTYSEQYRDPRWQKISAEIKQRDEWMCQNIACMAEDKQLHVHHLYYVPGRDVWDYPHFALTTLCVDCHKQRMPEWAGFETLLEDVGFDVLHTFRHAWLMHRLHNPGTTPSAYLDFLQNSTVLEQETL